MRDTGTAPNRHSCSCGDDPVSRKGSRAVSFQRAPVRLLIRALLGEYWQQSNWQADNRRLPATRRFTRQALTEGNSSQPRQTVQTIHPSRPPQSPRLLYVVFPTCQPLRQPFSIDSCSEDTSIAWPTHVLCCAGSPSLFRVPSS